jgi:hypothetical protein
MSASIALECPRSAAQVPSNSDSPLRPEIPINPAPRRHHSSDLLSKLLLQRWPPGHELKPHPVIDHGETAGRECDAPPVYARDMLTFGRWAMGEPSLGR